MFDHWPGGVGSGPVYCIYYIVYSLHWGMDLSTVSTKLCIVYIREWICLLNLLYCEQFTVGMGLARLGPVYCIYYIVHSLQ